MAVFALYLYDRFSVEGGRSPSEERASQKGGFRPFSHRDATAGLLQIAVIPRRIGEQVQSTLCGLREYFPMHESRMPNGAGRLHQVYRAPNAPRTPFRLSSPAPTANS
jgi:hypothetical protein